MADQRVQCGWHWTLNLECSVREKDMMQHWDAERISRWQQIKEWTLPSQLLSCFTVHLRPHIPPMSLKPLIWIKNVTGNWLWHEEWTEKSNQCNDEKFFSVCFYLIVTKTERYKDKPPICHYWTADFLISKVWKGSHQIWSERLHTCAWERLFRLHCIPASLVWFCIQSW